MPTAAPADVPTDTIWWADGAVEMIDQTLLPQEVAILRTATVPDLVAAIQRLSVRGAPALGVAGAYGVALAARTSRDLPGAMRALREARPTAVNLARMVDRVAAVLATDGVDAALAEAHAIRDEEVAASVAMGERGADLVADLVDRPAVRAMTVCNTGGLAAVRRGTALAVVQTLHERGGLADAMALETRPLLQGARLTAWELGRMGAPHHLVVDSAGPALIARGEVDVVLAGADRIAADGDVANKIGTFSLALAAAHAGIPFLVVAPESTVDHDTARGADIVIEDRGAEEVRGVRDVPVAPPGTPVRNPAFDVTPAALVTAIVTDRRVIRPAAGERP